MKGVQQAAEKPHPKRRMAIGAVCDRPYLVDSQKNRQS